MLSVTVLNLPEYLSTKCCYWNITSYLISAHMTPELAKECGDYDECYKYSRFSYIIWNILQYFIATCTKENKYIHNAHAVYMYIPIQLEQSMNWRTRQDMGKFLPSLKCGRRGQSQQQDHLAVVNKTDESKKTKIMDSTSVCCIWISITETLELCLIHRL